LFFLTTLLICLGCVTTTLVLHQLCALIQEMARSARRG
jgi:hypothetical protein